MKVIFSFMLGVMFGGMIGGVAGLVLAPHTGEETRERIRANVDEIIAEGRRAAEARREEMQAQFNQLRG
jgi:gas vesicle protein